MTTPAIPDARVIGGEWIHRDGDHATLTITKCHNCGSTWFPPRDVCSSCASADTEETTTADHGIAYASTVVRIGPAAFRPPYVLAYVDISDVRVLAHVDALEALPPGTPVTLRVGPIGADENGEFSSYLVAETAGGAR